MKLARLSFNLNGVDRFVTCDPENDTLAEVLRRMGLTGVKIGCGTGVCGACSVILNGEVVRACTKKMKRVAEFSTITTIEGIGTPQHLHPLQQAWITYGGAQCGFCSRASSSPPTASWPRTRRPPVKRCALGSKTTTTSAAAPVTNPWSTPSWPPLRSCGARRPWTTSLTTSRVRPRSTARGIQGPPLWPRSPALPTTATTWPCRCRPAPRTSPSCSPRPITPTFCRSTPAKPRPCRASSRS